MDTIAYIEAIPVQLPYRMRYAVSQMQFDAEGKPADHVFVRMESSSGLVGWGEVHVAPTWCREGIQAVVAIIERHLAPLIIGKQLVEFGGIRASLERAINATSAVTKLAKTALEMALLDLLGKYANLPVHALLGGKQRDELPIARTVSMDTPEWMYEQARQWERPSWLKVNISGDVPTDLDRLEAVARAQPQAALWIDAGGGFASVSQALRFLDQAGGVGNVIACQRPLPSGNWLAMHRLREKSPLPLAVDDGCESPHHVAQVAALNAADMVVLKIGKAGGLVEAKAMACVAHAHGLELMGGTLLEAGVGIAGAVHLFATLPIDIAIELDGCQFLDSLMVSGLELFDHRVKVPDAPGLGVTVNEDELRARMHGDEQ